MIRWNGFAELGFRESARLAFARALDLVHTDAHGEFPDAWVIDERSISFSLTAETSRPVLEAIQRVLGALVLGAVSGEAVIECEHPSERWMRRASVPTISSEIVIGDDVTEDANPGQTIRTAS